MSNAYVIEVQDEAAGLLVRDGSHFQFCATARAYAALEGHRFSGPLEAEQAAIQIAARRPGKAAKQKSDKHGYR